MASDTRADGQARKFALLVQNDAYPDSDPAKTADKDAATLAAALKTAGFEVELKRNVGRQALRESIANLVAEATPKTVTLFYYRGIAIQAGRLDYLVPVDAAIWSEEDLRREGTSLDRLMTDLDRRGAAVKIAIVDAARPNPFERRFRMVSAGLAPISAPRGSLVLFAEALGAVAEPGKGSVSPFMTELAKQLDGADNMETAFARTREGVAKRSGGRELPWVLSTLATPSLPPAAKPPQPQTATLAPPKPPPTPPPAKPQASPKPAALPPRPGDTFTDCDHCPEMSVLPAASFEMGSGTTPFDRPVHEVTFATPFAMAVVPVTRDEWKLCVTDGGCAARPQPEGGAADLPVVDVTWQDASQYAGFLSKKTGKTYRLPSEAEWEYAAHGGKTSAFAWGDTRGVGHANCTDCGGKGSPELRPVRSYPKNGFGLYDMGGNVMQWLQDCWRLTYRGAPTDGSATTAPSCDMRAVRGGSFETTAAYIKPTARFRAAAETRSRSLGIRVVRALPEAAARSN